MFSAVNEPEYQHDHTKYIVSRSIVIEFMPLLLHRISLPVRFGLCAHSTHRARAVKPGKKQSLTQSVRPRKVGSAPGGRRIFAVCFLLYPRCSRLARSRAGPAPEMPAAFIADHIVQPLDHIPRHILRQRRPDGRPILKNDPVAADSRRLAAVLGRILRRVQREEQNPKDK